MRVTFRCFQQAFTQVSSSLDFVPQAKPASLADVTRLQQFVSDANRVLVLTGAGLSTESGIPDYRSEGVGLYARTSRRPIHLREFVRSHSARQRFWAQNFVGWPKFSSFQPNIAHQTLQDWQQKGKVGHIVTQNVDSLHTKAGCSDVIELHGCSHRVKCLSCHRLSKRADLQLRFEELNPAWNVVGMHRMLIAPDVDVLLDDGQDDDFKVPECSMCGGVLMPDVTFFGDSVSRPVVDMVYNLVDSSNALLIVGSSLHVYSGYRFVARAADRNIPIGIVNVGDTRADHLAQVKVEALCGTILPQIQVGK